MDKGRKTFPVDAGVKVHTIGCHPHMGREISERDWVLPARGIMLKEK